MLFGCILYAVTVQREVRLESLRAVEKPAPATVIPAPSVLPDQIDLLHEEWHGQERPRVTGEKQKAQ